MNDRKRKPPLYGTITGRAGADAEMKYSRGGKSYVRLSVALNCRKLPRDAAEDERPQALWVSVIASRGDDAINTLGEVLKGQAVTVSGEMRLEGWIDRSGQQRESWTLFVDPDAAIDAGGQRRERREPEPRRREPERGNGGFRDEDESDIPF